MNILPYTIANTNDLLTGRGGLVCVAGLPAGVRVSHLRADAAGYQGAVFAYCDEQEIEYVVRAKRSKAMKAWILERPESVWTPLRRDGEAVAGQATCRGVWAMDKYKTPFTLVVQRYRKGGQQSRPRQTACYCPTPG
ncbi:MAG: hypothetical protein OXI88_02735 [Gammaproteobacteria bacterium]|nr:hypothetical protein [Gammaproteobacteria bacterium]